MIKTKNFKFPQSSFQRYKNHCAHFANIIVELSFKKNDIETDTVNSGMKESG